MVYCPECGAEVSPEESHCYSCGYALEERGRGQGQFDRQPEQYEQEQYGDRREVYGDRRVGDPPGPEPQGVSIADGKLSYALKFPTSGGRKELLVGGVCGLLSVLLIPLVILASYLYKFTGAAARGERVQPDFGEFSDAIGPGLVYAVTLVFFAVLGNGISLALGADPTDPSSVNASAQAISSLVSLVIGYFLPAFYTTYAATGSLPKAVSLVPSFAFSKKYLVSYFIFFAVSIGVTLLSVLLVVVLALTIIGLFLVPFLVAGFVVYLYYFQAAFFGATYYEAAQEGTVPPAGRSQEGDRFHSQGTQRHNY